MFDHGRFLFLFALAICSTISRSVFMDILLISSPFQGHIRPMINLGEELVNHGHNVTLISLSWDNNEEIAIAKGMEFVSAGTLSIGRDQVYEMYREAMEWNPSAFQDMLVLQIYPIVEYVREVNLTSWDIIVSDDFASNSIACIANNQQVPILSVSPRPDPMLTWLNMPAWSIPLSLFAGYPEQMTFAERFSVTVLGTAINVANGFYMWTLFYPPFIREECKSVLYTSISDGHEYPLLILSAMGFDYPRTVTPLTHYIGPIYPKQHKQLSVDLEMWLNSRKQCIIISMGSLLSITPTDASQIVQAIGDSPLNFSAVWSLKNYENVLKDVEYDPNQFHITDWIPQFVVMQHKAIAVAVLHGGAGGINDALYNGVPVVCMPYGGDQLQNCHRIHELGAGLMLPRGQQTADKIKESIETIANDNKFKVNARKISKLLQSGGGIDKAVELVELYGTVGYEHLKPSYVKHKWSLVQYYNIDVYLTIFSATTILGMGLVVCKRRFC